MTARRDLPEELRGRSFAVRDAVALDLPSHRLDALDLTAPFHGVRTPVAQTLDRAMLCRALATRFRPDDAFDGATAVGLWGAPLPLRFGAAALLHVSALSPRRALRRRGVRGTQRSAGRVLLQDAIPLLSPVDA